MITWRKSLDMEINYQDLLSYDDKRVKFKNLPIKVTNTSVKISNPMELHIQPGKVIVVDAEYMLQACKKALAMHAI